MYVLSRRDASRQFAHFHVLAFAFFFGQTVASCGHADYEHAFLLLLAIGCGCLGCFWRTYLQFALIGASLGLLSALALYAGETAPAVHDDERVLFSVTDQPKRTQSNLLTFPIRVDEVMPSRSRDDEAIRKIRGKHLYCSSYEAPWRNISGIRAGDRYIGEIAIFGLRRRLSLFSYENSLRRRGILARCKVKNVVRVSQGGKRAIYDSIITWLMAYPGFELEGGLFASLVFGYRTSLSTILERHFQKTGLSHLLVFSGAQVTMLFFVLFHILYFFFASILYILRIYRGLSVSRILALVMTAYFVLSIGSDKSTVRALIAAVVSYIAITQSRRSSIGWSALVTALIMAVLWPGSFLEPGMQLTYAALFGIWLGVRCRSYFAMCLYTSLATSSISLFWFEAFSVTGFLLNPVVVPLVSSVVMIIGLPAFISAYHGYPAGVWVLERIFFCLRCLEEGVYWASQIPWGYLVFSPLPAKLAGSTGLAILLWKARAVSRESTDRDR